MLIRTGFVQIKPLTSIAVHTSCLALLTEDSPKSTHGHFSLVHLICVCSFSGYLLFIYIAVGKKIIIIKHAVVCFYFNVVVSNKLSNISHASLKSYLSEVGRHGRA